MLAVSTGFLQAIKNKAQQDVRLEFSNGDVIGSSDIAITAGGLTYTEILNGDTDMTFGEAVMSELSAVLVNSDGRFTNFNFEREFTAKIGVKVGDSFEYVNLGVFKGERPDKVRGKLIDFTSHDRMSLFEKSAESFADGLTFPCTLGEIYTKLCSFCGVGYVSATFTNSGKTFTKNPLEGTDYTCREILGWIAEAAGSYARMSRNGAVELVWFAAADYTVTRKDRFEMTESEFLTPPIDKLEVYNSYGDQLNSSGVGDIVYGISDNPFLYIENDTQLEGLQPYVDAIYNRITSLPAYHPSSFRAEFNPAVQCGDIISVVDDYDETIRFPVFIQTITWNGFGKSTYENTGGVIRQNAPFTQRELEQLKKKSVKTKDLWTYIDSYLSTDEGVSAIKAAVGGEFVTQDDLEDYTATEELEATIAGYIKPGEASLVNALNGSYVSESALNGYVQTSNLATSVTQEIKDGRVKLELSASEDSSTEVTEVDVGEKYEGIFAGDDETEVWTFSDKDGEGYYVSQNGGIYYSCSYMRLDFNFSEATEVTFRCVCMGETKYDYGLISAVDRYLTTRYIPDDDGEIINMDVFYSFRNQHSATPVDFVMTIPAGSHYVTIKYCKDGSTNATGDYFKVRAFVSKTETTSSKSTITLTAGGTVISSADITFKGYVTFESLSTPGATTIDGANINTDNLHVQKIYMGGSTSREILYSTLMSNGAGQIHFGFMETLASMSYAHDIRLYAKKIYFIPPGGDENSDETLLFDISERDIEGNSSWKLYNVS